MWPERCKGLFVSDLDGILLREGCMVTPEGRRALLGLAGERVVSVIAAGRSFHSTRTCLSEDFPIDYMVCSDVNQIIEWSTERRIFDVRLRPDDAMMVRNVLMELDLDFMAYGTVPAAHCFGFHRSRHPVADFERRMAVHADYARNRFGGEASQFVVIVDRADEAMVRHLKDMSRSLSVIQSTSPYDGRSIWIEIFAPNISKASGIRIVVRLGPRACWCYRQ